MASVELVRLRQLNEARCSDDDWTGLGDQSERRRRQTRLAVRAHRKRKAAQKLENHMYGSKNVLRLPANQQHIGSSRHTVTPTILDLCIPSYLRWDGQVVPLRKLYPISRDHLLPLVEYNVLRASLTNVLILGYSHLMGSNNCGFGKSLPVFLNSYEYKGIPVSLRPTALQQSTPHPDWIDLLPSPRMRDNAIMTQHQFTNSELCADVMGGLVNSQHNIDSGLVVWSNPWEASGWELTEGFVRKWGFLIQGCTDLFQSTNRWRELRGEARLTWE
ncbi:hypothetical protein BP6252_07457 [Coleophoma cylindrospora]|uniref:BZIP domain-containing protein n=1 Tax=Coleophoma cylindrospora TaxID=1849047 RepID=A0A3D8RHV1_9HELO|nr:hypothetical protein BP6252_07457 [Coleophoma cylindrospora]